MRVWVAYDKSRARLPIAVADSAAELALMVHANKNNVKTMASKLRHGVLNSSRFACVDIEEDEDGDD